MAARQKFATQIDEKLLEQVRALAQRDGRHIQAIVEDALRAHMKNITANTDDVLETAKALSNRYKGTLEYLER